MQDHLKDLNIGGRPMTDKELAEHYKHLYSTIKKQKDDVIKVLHQLKGSARWERHLYEVDYMLRMLGDSDDTR